jgi:tol-pal system protein YbgF
MRTSAAPGAAIPGVPARIVLLGLVSLASGCATLAGAGEDPTAARIDEMDQRLARLERVAGNQALTGLSQRIDALQAEVRALRGEVETLENANESLRRQQRDLYADLDRRLVSGERSAPAPVAATAPTPSRPAAAGGGAVAPGPAAGPAGTVTAAGAAAGDGPGRVYGRAFDALKSADYPVAIAGMREFLAAYPAHELADNAQYWLGEAYYVTRDYANAEPAFGAVVQRWPDSAKAPDAMLKLGYSQFELKRYAAARETLERVGQRYPGSDAARLATERLRRIPADGR